MEMMVTVDDQPISATFFNEGRWLTSFITPNALEVQNLYHSITEGLDEVEDKIMVCWDWVANKVKYVRFVKARLWVNGHSSVQGDYWQVPSQVIKTRIGNCANKAFLLTSLLRNDIDPERVKCVLGNLHQPGNSGGHAWVELSIDGHRYIMESTRGDMAPLVAPDAAPIYEGVIFFNDRGVKAIEGKTLLEPFTAVYADWLRDYLDWAYIEGRK